MKPLEGGQEGVQAGVVRSELKKLVKDKKTKALGLPLSGVEMSKITRKANYKVTEGKAKEWLPRLKQLAKSEQVDFTKGGDDTAGKVNLRMIATGGGEGQDEGVVGEMEREVQRQLGEQKMGSYEQRKEYEEGELGRMLSAEEVERRVGELARMKHLLFQEEAKRKRSAKIKSKLYHKIKKRGKQKTEAALLESLEHIDPEAADRYRREMEEKRAEERANQRHATSSRFARTLMRYGKKENKETRDAFHEMVRKREELHKKVKSVSGASVLKDDDDDEVLSFFSD